jgi:Tetratricopeptide repeat/Cytochrome c554 and c-prime
MNDKLTRWTAIAFLALLANTAYLAAYATASIFYMANVLLHLVLGLAVAVGFAVLLRRRPELRRGSPQMLAATAFFAAALLAGLWLTIAGNLLAYRWVLWLHEAAAALGVAALALWAFRRAGDLATPRFRQALTAVLALLVLLPAGTFVWRHTHPDPAAEVRNPMIVPASMQQEGGGPASPFFPSSAKTNVGGIIPSNFFMDSATCGECHKDIYEQWKSSAHHFASFNNQFYRKSVEYMQDVVGPQPSKWCAGCHDHAVFFNGRFERPIKGQIDTPAARAGLACTSCHAITHVGSTMGNGGFTIAYPALHELANSKNPVIKQMDHFLTYLNPEPHRRTFLKPFMRNETAEFCSPCHKVHLDGPVNHYRWFRGFNEYDAWQASGVSGQGARSFYYPAASKNCAECHMPLVASNDPGNRGGLVHSHRFPAANTALPFVNKDKEQLEVVEKFLQSGIVSVDLFAAAPEEKEKGDTPMLRHSAGSFAPQAMSTFAVGEEAEQSGPVTLRDTRDVSRVVAPLDVAGRAGAHFAPGSTVRVDAVVRTRTVGHFFPGGTVDAFDVWLELQARDATGRVIFWSGKVDRDADGRSGPVEPGAHFYKSLALDAEGNPINKRNAWQARTVLYARLIPPGAADTVHFRLHIPQDAKGPITLSAKLNYRKFSWYYTQFAYAGKPKPGQSPQLVSADSNSLQYTFHPKDVPADVSGQIKGEIPDLPIIVLARAEATLNLGTGPTDWRPVVRKEDRERWNDWGIGLLLQGDLRGAEFAFQRVTEAEPGYADGWLNAARALVREGEMAAAKPYVAKALAIDPSLARIYFFKALIEKAEGSYDDALASLRTAAATYPRDRVLLNQIARILFLKRQYKEALAVLQRVCAIDPEDLQLHYTSMLCWRALGNRQKADSEEALFRRFKAEESSQSITAIRRMLSPEDNNERQPIHEHDSVPLDDLPLQRMAPEQAPVAGG